ncbi:N-acetylmuramoyl-L-alanine amidase [Brevibacillus dissolubilis]|uniref:N-acetylmuramoyl-L-alanine amidase n=1 Tax=Brevibacillus dissolubilis TaxID=1844116 RepID=UPI00111638F0|nr:N-acetylmuramoyl-L-alanine amidase [Brevibacillus dissolubilis]
MKRFFMLMAVLVWATWFYPQMSHAETNTETVHMMIEGKRVESDVPPLIQNGRTLVPVRVIAEGLGAEVGWEPETQTAKIVREKQEVVLTLGKKQAWVNGQAVKLDSNPLLQDGRMLLPLRFVGEALGMTIGWDSQAHTVVANKPISLKLNGKDFGGSYKAYKWEEKLLVPVDSIGQSLGLPAGLGKKLSSTKIIDSTLVAPLADVEEVLDGKIEWNSERGQITVERYYELDSIQLEGERLLIDTDKPITPEITTMQSPERIVIDLKHTVLSDELAHGDKEIRIPSSEASESVEESTDRNKQDIAENPENKNNNQLETNSTFPPSDSMNGDQAGDRPADISNGEPEQEPLVRAIRFSQYSTDPYTVRIVLELNRKATYQMENLTDGFGLKLIPGTQKTGYLIVIDPGHGGKDSGAIGTAGNQEKAFNLAVGNRLIELLKQHPEFQVAATRTTDVFPTLQERADLANKMEADLFLSIHANSFQASTRGTETFYYHANSKSLAQVVHRHLLSATSFPDRKTKVGNLYVLRNTTMPAVLIEAGFLSNPTENQQLMSPAFQEKVAQALAAAIVEYYQANH